MKVQSADAGVTQATTAALAQDAAARRPRGAAGAAPDDRTDLSRLGALLDTLQDLAQRDPERHRRAVASLSSRLDAAAAAQPGGGGELFEALARKFRQSGGAPSPAPGRGTAASAYARAGWTEPSALEDLLEASLKESAA